MPSDAFRMTGESVGTPGTFSVLGPDGYYELFDTEDDANLAAALGNKLLDVTPEPVSGDVESAGCALTDNNGDGSCGRPDCTGDNPCTPIETYLASPEPESVVLEGRPAWFMEAGREHWTIHGISLTDELMPYAVTNRRVRLTITPINEDGTEAEDANHDEV